MAKTKKRKKGFAELIRKPPERLWASAKTPYSGPASALLDWVNSNKSFKDSIIKKQKEAQALYGAQKIVAVCRANFPEEPTFNISFLTLQEFCLIQSETRMAQKDQVVALRRYFAKDFQKFFPPILVLWHVGTSSTDDYVSELLMFSPPVAKV